MLAHSKDRNSRHSQGECHNRSKILDWSHIQLMRRVDAEQKLDARSHGRALQEDQQRRVDGGFARLLFRVVDGVRDRKSTRLNSSHSQISYAVFCLKKKKK